MALFGDIFKKTEIAPEQQAQYFTRFIRNFPSGILMYDTSFVVQAFNPVCEQIFDLKAQEVIGKRLDASQASDARFRTLVQVVFSSLAPVVIVRSDPGAFPQIADISFEDPRLDLYVVSDRMTDAQGRVTGFLKVITDKTRETELLKSKTEFIAVAAHQLRTPLTAINWALEALEHEELTESQKEIVNTAFGAAKNALNTVNNLLDVSKMEEGKFGYSFTQLDITAFLQDILTQVQSIAQQYTVQLYFDKPEEPLYIQADPQKLGMVFYNLLDNAIKYNVENGQVVVKVEKKADAPFIEISIRDTGIGVPKDQIDRLFSKFFRAENAVKTVADGTGLGLYIARNIAMQHKGDITVESELNRGTIFRVILPLQPAMTQNFPS